jgi:hypothetical protein
VLSIREIVAPSLTPSEGQSVEGTPMRSPSGLVIPLPWGCLDTFVSSDDKDPDEVGVSLARPPEFRLGSYRASRFG